MDENDFEKLFPGEMEPTAEYQPPCWHNGHTNDDPCASCLYTWSTLVEIALGAD